nr:hypothetical protein [Streptococcus thoraltensis]
MVLFRAEGLTYKEITTLIGFSKYAILSLTRKYEAEGISEVIDGEYEQSSQELLFMRREDEVIQKANAQSR